MEQKPTQPPLSPFVEVFNLGVETGKMLMRYEYHLETLRNQNKELEAKLEAKNG